MKRFFPGIISLCLSLAVIFGIGELYFRFIFDATDYYNASLTSKAWGRRHDMLNTLGFRDREYPSVPGATDMTADSAATPLRIAFIGDSFTYGQGIKDASDRFSDIAGAALQAKYTHVSYHNISKPGWNTAEEIEYLLNHPELPHFDVLIFQYFVNDIGFDVSKFDQTQEIRDYLQMAKSIHVRPDNAVGWLRNNSYAVDFAYNQFIRTYYAGKYSYQNVLQTIYASPEAWNDLTRQFSKVKDFAAINNAKILFVLFPPMTNPGREFSFRSIHNKISDHLASQGVDYLDLYPTFNTYKTTQVTVSPIDHHPNEFAHRVAAREIVSRLDTIIRDIQ